MRHEEGDEEVSVKDCILLVSGNRKKDLPYIAKVNSLWENPEDGKSSIFITQSKFYMCQNFRRNDDVTDLVL